ncbi:MAG: hypothetical protein E5V89_01900 [Mesorhizobium sp.]|nr:MAG: hypothetical protein E5V89_01900 [Mesorhizobium sp.]
MLDCSNCSFTRPARSPSEFALGYFRFMDKESALALVQRHRVVGELEVPIIPAGGATLVTADHLDQIPVHGAMIRPKALDQLGNVERRLSLAGEASTETPVPASSFLPSVSSVNGNFIVMAILMNGSPHQRGLYSSLPIACQGLPRSRCPFGHR